MTTKSSNTAWHQANLPLTHPWDVVLGAPSLVRALRVLVATPEPMPVRELARRAGQHLRAVQVAVRRLDGAGVVEYVGAGRRPQVRLAQDHPLVPALRALFEAEKARVDRLEGAIRSALEPMARKLDAAWIEPPEAGTGPSAPRLTIGILAPSGTVSELADGVGRALAPIGNREDVALDVAAWSRPDLLTMSAAQRAGLRRAWPLLGTPPAAFLDDPRVATGRGTRATHADRERAAEARVQDLAAIIRQQPEVLRAARKEVERRMRSLEAPEARTWREWHDILSQRPRRLVDWLKSDRSDAVRLRQSLPTVFTRALREAEEARSRSGGASDDA